MKNPKPKPPKWIVWSFDDAQGQTFADILIAKNPGEAAARVQAARPYATLDQFIPPMPLSDYIERLQREAESTEDHFVMIEQEAAL